MCDNCELKHHFSYNIKNKHKGKIMTLHLNASDSVSQKILSFLESLTKQGEHIEIIDDSLYQYEKAGILKGLEQVKNGDVYSCNEVLKELNK